MLSRFFASFDSLILLTIHTDAYILRSDDFHADNDSNNNDDDNNDDDNNNRWTN